MNSLGTDLWPAISLAYEKAESDIMTKRPRNPKKDKLINVKLVFLTYGQIGVIQACASYTSFLYMMGMHGFSLKTLIGIKILSSCTFTTTLIKIDWSKLCAT